MTPLDDRDPVDVLAEEFVERLRRGEHPSVSDYAARHPDHAEQLQQLLPAVAQMESLKKFRRATGLVGETPQLPDRFGDFRIVRELGRGGMGVVFEAVQESLGRPVALKVLATHSQFDVVRHERFIREAHAAARLHHTNIVPVFGVGEQDGIPYYVMQLIRGQGLNAVAQRWRREQGKSGESAHLATPLASDLGSAPTPMSVDLRKPISQATQRASYDVEPITKYGNWRFVAEVGLQAAEALHYAHKQGVLHRDIKPANLLLDSASRVWITDFGLAKLIDRNGLTASGDILGTLQYLAPECLTGDSDPRSDVYGVGATLYELLTLIPPYPIDTPVRLVKLVTDTDPVPPRQINADIPLDLETIVLKAMAREPDHRYVSAREFARDLQAFLEDRPIKARRQHWTNRARRWCRKNKAITALSCTAASLLLLAAILGWIGFARTNQALEDQANRTKEADDARQDAEKASAKLTENLKDSLAAFEAVFNAASSNRQGYGIVGWFQPERAGRPKGPGPDGPGGPGPAGFGGAPGGPGSPGGGSATDTSARMLEAVLLFYDKFADKNSTEPELQLEAAKAHRRVGEARMWAGDKLKAKSSFTRAIESLRTLQETYPDKEKYAIELVQTYLTAPPEIAEVNEEALVWSINFARGLEPNAQPYLVGLLSLKLGSMRDRSGNQQDAESAYRDAVAGLSAPDGAIDGRPPPVVTYKAWARYSLAVLLTNAKRYPDARNVLNDLVEELDTVTERNGRGSMQQDDVKSFAYEQLVVVYEHLGDRNKSAEASRAAEELKRELKFGKPGGHKGPPPKKD